MKLLPDGLSKYKRCYTMEKQVDIDQYSVSIKGEVLHEARSLKQLILESKHSPSVSTSLSA